VGNGKKLPKASANGLVFNISIASARGARVLVLPSSVQ
jgi:hypothetical protein